MSYLAHVSCLIRTREYEVGFPPEFTHYPEKMPQEVRTTLLGLVQDAMGNDLTQVRQDREGIRRRVVIREGDYLVLGICSFLTDFLDDPEGQYGNFCDRANRPVYGFFGFVWNLRINYLPITFPPVDSFRKLAEELIVAHWFAPRSLKGDEEYADNQWKAQIELKGGYPHPFNVKVPVNTVKPSDWSQFNEHQPEQIKIFPHTLAEEIVASAVQEAKACLTFSLCTNLPMWECPKTGFMNATSDTRDLLGRSDSMENRLSYERHQRVREAKSDAEGPRTDEGRWEQKNIERGKHTKSTQSNAATTRRATLVVSFSSMDGVELPNDVSNVFKREFLNGNGKLRKTGQVNSYPITISLSNASAETYLEEALGEAAKATEKILARRGEKIRVRAKLNMDNDGTANTPPVPRRPSNSVDIDKIFSTEYSAGRRGGTSTKQADPFAVEFEE